MSLPSPGRLLREPALHFLVLGLGLFALHARVRRPPPERIVVSAAFADALAAEQAALLGKPPTIEERQALVDRWVDEELLYREALALGLDRGDPIVRRRLVQKMERVGEGASPLPEPGDAELQAFLDAHADRFQEPARTSFEQVFVSRDRRGEAAEGEARRLAGELRGGADPARFGDPFLQGRAWSLRSAPEIAQVFGPSFAAEVAALPPGRWSDPIASSYGEHLVRVSEQRPGRTLPLAAVRPRVAEEWMSEERERRRRAVVDGLRQRATVEIEGNHPTTTAGLARSEGR
ncbi:MAG: peptidylprolyl isomerase [Byssovorax sp.]